MQEILQGVAFRRGLAHYCVTAHNHFVRYGTFQHCYVWKRPLGYVCEILTNINHSHISVDATVRLNDLTPYMNQFTDEHIAEIVAAVLRGEIK